MKVLYLSHTALMSGAERTMLELIRALPDEVEPVLVSPAGQFADVGRQLGIDVHEIPEITGSSRLHPLHTSRTLLELSRASRELRRVVGATRPQVIHAKGPRAALICAGSRARRDLAVVLHQHDDLAPTPLGRLVGTVLDRSADAALAVSAHAAKCLSEAGFRGELHALHDPVDLTRFDPAAISRAQARAEIGLPGDAQVIGVVAQITPWKGHDTAIEAVAELHGQFPDLRLLIVGTAKFVGRAVAFDNVTYLESLKRLATQRGLEHAVEFWGERPDIPRILRALDVLLCPSWHEPFGRSIAEAMAMETPVIATTVGGPPEFIEHGVSGLLCPPREPAAWAAAIERLLRDRSSRDEMGRQARAAAQAFEPHRYARRVVAIYEEILRRRQASRPG